LYCIVSEKFHLYIVTISERDGAGNTIEENSSIFSLIWMR